MRGPTWAANPIELLSALEGSHETGWMRKKVEENEGRKKEEIFICARWMDGAVNKNESLSGLGVCFDRRLRACTFCVFQLHEYIRFWVCVCFIVNFSFECEHDSFLFHFRAS